MGIFAIVYLIVTILTVIAFASPLPGVKGWNFIIATWVLLTGLILFGVVTV